MIELLVWMKMTSEVRGRYDGTTSRNTSAHHGSNAVPEGDIGTKSG